MGNLGAPEILILLLLALVFFGGSRLAGIGKGLGEGIKNFKKGLKDDDDDGAKGKPEGTDKSTGSTPSS